MATKISDWKPQDGDAWRSDPGVMMDCKPKKGTSWVALVIDGVAYVRANDTRAAGMGWTTVLHLLFKAALMSPAFLAEARRVLDVAEAEAAEVARG